MMPASVLLPQLFLPRSAVNLGRFVINVNEPHQDFHDPASDPTSNITEKVQTHYNNIHRAADHRNFASDLTSFVSSSFSKRANTSISITADEVKTYYLNNTGQWFRDAVQLEPTRKWIERTIDEGEDVYLVVGCHTVLDAQIIEQHGGQSTSGGKLVMPVSAALTATGVVVPMGNINDAGLSGSRGRMEDEQRHFKAQGEQICAVQYRKVRLRWFASSKVDNMMLGKETQWKRYDRPRYLERDGEDMIEADLDDDLAIGGDRDTWTMESGEIVFSSFSSHASQTLSIQPALQEL
jgi:hypothetical protein